MACPPLEAYIRREEPRPTLSSSIATAELLGVTQSFALCLFSNSFDFSGNQKDIAGIASDTNRFQYASRPEVDTMMWIVSLLSSSQVAAIDDGCFLDEDAKHFVWFLKGFKGRRE